MSFNSNEITRSSSGIDRKLFNPIEISFENTKSWASKPTIGNRLTRSIQKIAYLAMAAISCLFEIFKNFSICMLNSVIIPINIVYALATKQKLAIDSEDPIVKMSRSEMGFEPIIETEVPKIEKQITEPLDQDREVFSKKEPKSEYLASTRSLEDQDSKKQETESVVPLKELSSVEDQIAKSDSGILATARSVISFSPFLFGMAFGVPVAIGLGYLVDELIMLP